MLASLRRTINLVHGLHCQVRSLVTVQDPVRAVVHSLTEDPLAADLRFESRPVPPVEELPPTAVVVAVRSCAVHWVDLCTQCTRTHTTDLPLTLIFYCSRSDACWAVPAGTALALHTWDGVCWRRGTRGERRHEM